MDFVGATRLELLPKTGGQPTAVDAHALRCEVLANSLDIALEDDVRVAVGDCIRDLGEVDQRDLTLPVEKVIGLEIAVVEIGRQQCWRYKCRQQRYAQARKGSVHKLLPLCRPVKVFHSFAPR